MKVLYSKSKSFKLNLSYIQPMLDPIPPEKLE